MRVRPCAPIRGRFSFLVLSLLATSAAAEPLPLIEALAPLAAMDARSLEDRLAAPLGPVAAETGSPEDWLERVSFDMAPLEAATVAWCEPRIGGAGDAVRRVAFGAPDPGAARVRPPVPARFGRTASRRPAAASRCVACAMPVDASLAGLPLDKGVAGYAPSLLDALAPAAAAPILAAFAPPTPGPGAGIVRTGPPVAAAPPTTFPRAPGPTVVPRPTPAPVAPPPGSGPTPVPAPPVGPGGGPGGVPPVGPGPVPAPASPPSLPSPPSSPDAGPTPPDATPRPPAASIVPPVTSIFGPPVTPPFRAPPSVSAPPTTVVPLLPPADLVPAVPLPASVWLLLAALGITAAAGRGRRGAQ